MSANPPAGAPPRPAVPAADLRAWTEHWLRFVALDASTPSRAACIEEDRWSPAPDGGGPAAAMRDPVQPDGTPRNGRYARTRRAPWHGHDAVWIDAVLFHEGALVDRTSMVLPVNVDPATGAAAPVGGAVEVHAPPARQSVSRTFWAAFILGPSWYFSARDARRRAEARGEDGRRFIRAWAAGWATGIVFGLVVSVTAAALFGFSVLP